MLIKTLGPRGQVGINPGMVAKSLASLEILATHASQEQGTVRYFTRGDGTQWIQGCSKPMGGKSHGSRSSLQRLNEKVEDGR